MIVLTVLRKTMIIRKMNCEEIRSVLPLIWDVFCEFEAPNYPEKAKQLFRNAIYDESYLSQLEAYGAYDDGSLIGIIATRNDGRHVALFFVDGEHHNQGIGRKLWEHMLDRNPNGRITVHSSLFAVPVYEKLGFVRTDDIRTEDGISFIPMVFDRQQPREKA